MWFAATAKHAATPCPSHLHNLGLARPFPRRLAGSAKVVTPGRHLFGTILYKFTQNSPYGSCRFQCLVAMSPPDWNGRLQDMDKMNLEMVNVRLRQRFWADLFLLVSQI